MKRLFAFLFIGLLLISCSEHDSSAKHEILDEYLLINYNSWKYVNSIEYNTIPNFRVNDTIELNSDIRLLTFPEGSNEDAPLSEENMLEYTRSTRIKLTREIKDRFYNPIYYFATVGQQPILRGVLSSDELLNAQEGLSSTLVSKNMFLDRILKQRNYYNEHIIELANKYNLTVDSLHKLVADQYYSITKEPIFTY